jgi:hypothetical protein
VVVLLPKFRPAELDESGVVGTRCQTQSTEPILR